MDENELHKRLLKTFRVEAAEHIETIGKGLIKVEKESKADLRLSHIEEIYRAAHSMKGAARAVNLINIEKLCQALESCFSKIKQGEINPNQRMFDVFHSSINTIELILDEQEEDKFDMDIIDSYVELLSNIEKLAEKDETNTSIQNKEFQETIPDNTEASLSLDYEEPESDRDKKKSTADTIRLATKLVDDIYYIAEDSLHIKHGQKEESVWLSKMKDQFAHFNERWQNLYKQSLRNTKSRNGVEFEEIEILNDGIKDIERTLRKLLEINNSISKSTENILDNLVDEIKQVLMLPFSHLFDSYPRIVRDLAKDMKKKIDLEIVGETIEVDRRIMEELKAPMDHILRNAIGHGIESPEVRNKKGKSEIGSISIKAIQTDSNRVLLSIKDDGAGIDTKKVIKEAEKASVFKDNKEDLKEENIIRLVFKSGISTSDIITDLSGRGLGLAIVEEKVEKLGGKVSIQSRKDEGCEISLDIPISIAKSQGLLLKVENNKYIIPTNNILETFRIKQDQIKKVENQDTIQYNGGTLTLLHLCEILDIPVKLVNESEFMYIVVLESLNQKIGIIVDEIANEQEVLFKPLNYPIIRLNNISGVCLLGSGEICPILNNQDIIRTAMKSSSLIQKGIEDEKDGGETANILIAEDSITSRLFLKNILESAGYKVKAVIDGKEAYTALKLNSFDLLVSDIEMPRMDGFELTEMVRNDKELADMPIVLVTSLGKKEHQERGIEVGANAYIVKSSFEQSNLLEVVKRLI